MQQQPLAFTIVKTVVSARDAGRDLSPPLRTAWTLLRAELPPAHRVISDEVSWSQDHQHDLKFVIDGLRQQFVSDPALEQEVIRFLSEVELYNEADREAMLPVLALTLGGTSAPSTSLGTPIQPAELDVEPDANRSPAQEALAEGRIQQTQPAESGEPATVAEPAVTAAPSVRRTSANSSGWQQTIGLATLGFAAVALIAFAALRSSDTETGVSAEVTASADVDERASSTLSLGDDDATAAPHALAARTPDARRIDSLRAAGAFAAAYELAAARWAGSTFDDAATRHAVAAEASTLAAALGRYADAVTHERQALDAAREAYGDRGVETGRSHLRLATYYRETGELLMAGAHLRQARHVFGQAQDIVAPGDRETADRLAETLLSS